MVTRAHLSWVVALLACAACATVAGVEVTRAGPGPENDTDEHAPPPEGGVLDGGPGPADGEADALATFACSCDAGMACCLGKSATECVARDTPACSDPGALLLGCLRRDDNGRDCCWNAVGPPKRTTLGPPCTEGRMACVVDDDCDDNSGPCITLSCNGATIGVCAGADASVPAGFLCP